ncbi:amino acid transporter [Fusarium langsethiae]|uniref:Amino acid transporter n=1 Tax=Fusarium langsethiae TaxID=179993 RepID=A0A0M9EVS2_FUSLA|nr:amino acid transporter [Fusarium langsethiae]GKU04897.1 unnamed protein product [Fusarium langsethiae]
MSQTSSDSSGNSDALELEAAGYQQAMPRRFSLWSLGALSFTLTCTWLGTGSSIGISLTEASSAGTLWSLPIAGVMTTIVSLGMAELASAYPVAGAQYYWSFMVARDDYKPFASYLNGWMSVIGWWLASSSVSNFVSSMILDIVGAWHPDWDQKRWHQYLIYVALIWIATSANIFMSRWIPLFNKMVFVLSVLTLSATTITLFVVTKNHASSKFIFTDTTNRTGWSSDGFAFMLAVGNAVYAFLGSDCGAHLCEEIPNPARNVPKVMIYPLLMGLFTAFPFAASLMYAISDISAVLNTTTGLPLFEIYFQGTGSRSGATVLMTLFAFCFFANLVANATTSSRTLWAVSRDGALPYSHFWERVHPKFEVPVNALLLSATFITLYGLIFLGSSTAFAAMVSAAIIFLQTSCVIPQAVLLYRGRERVLPLRYFNLVSRPTPTTSIALYLLSLANMKLAVLTTFVTAITAAKSPGYRFVGRVNPATKELTWPSTGVAFTFKGTEATININSITGTSSADLIIDGKDPIVIANVNGTSISVPKLPKGTHTVELRKRSETSFGTFIITGVSTDGKLLEAPPPKRKIEIIGDSISVGYGLDGVIPCVDTAALQNNGKTYGAVAARALNADYSVVAWSGKGLIRNYASSPPDTSPPMPTIYTRYGANDKDNSFTFPKSWVPDAVVINLGTNDFSYLNVRNPVNPADLTKALVKLVKSVQSHYPKAQFFFVSSPLLNDYYPTEADAQKSTHVRVLKDTMQQLSGKTHFVDWPTQGAEAGCDYHPNAATQAQGGQLLAASIKAALKW